MALTRDESSPLFGASAAGMLQLSVYLLLALTLIVLDHHYGWMWRVRHAVSLVVEPVYRLAGLPVSAIEAASVAFADRRKLTEDNQRLREELLLANARLNRMSAVMEQNQRLKELLATHDTLGLKAQLAHVIGVDMGHERQRILLDRGMRDRVHPGQPVIDAHGIFGQVTEVLPYTSEVLLVTHPNHAVPVVIERTGLRTIAFGSREGDHLVLPMMPLATEVKIGDRLLTSGVGGGFPAGFPVGVIQKIGTSVNGLFLEADAKPAANVSRSEDVLLLQSQAEPVGPPRQPAASTAVPVAASSRAMPPPERVR